ncbi:hypothetical protein K0U27_10610 [archaeon]|nr:hypothetical protein [archaeon]
MKFFTVFFFSSLIATTGFFTMPVTSFAEQPSKDDNFHKGTIEWISRCYMIDSDITVRVIDYDMNKDPEKSEQFDVQVWSDFDVNSDFENRIIDYTVTETGADTGIFESAVFFTTTDDSPGKRIRVVDNDVVFAKYADYTIPATLNHDVIGTFVMSGLFVLERDDNGRISKITYDPCALVLLEKNQEKFNELDIFYPAPLKQIKSGLHVDEIKCKKSLALVSKNDGTIACVTPESVQKLSERGWTAGVDLGKKIDKEQAYLATLMTWQVADSDQIISIDLEGPHNQAEQILQDYDVSVMSSKVTDDGSFSSTFGNMTHANLKKFFEENPMDLFLKRGLTIYPLGGFTDNTGTYGPFTQYVTEEQGEKMGIILEWYGERRKNMEKVGWDEITQQIEILTGNVHQANTSVEKKWTASYYLNHIPLPNGKFEENLENVILWNMMDQLESRGIENWKNDLTIGTNHADRWSNPSKLCSKIFLEDEREVYVSAEFYSEPELNITEIIIDDSKPDRCQKWFWIPNDVNFENGIMVFKYND